MSRDKQALFFGLISGITILYSYSLIILNISGLISALAFFAVLIIHFAVVIWLVHMGWQIASGKREYPLLIESEKPLYVAMHKTLLMIYTWSLIASMTGITVLIIGFANDLLYCISVAVFMVISCIFIYMNLETYNRMLSKLSKG